MLDFLISQTDYMLFLEGLALLTMGIVCHFVLERGKDQKLPWAWLGWFGIVFGTSRWIDMVSFALGNQQLISANRLTASTLIFFLLIEFARTGSTGWKPGRWIYIPLLAIVLLGGNSSWQELALAAGLFPVAAGGLWSALVIWRAAKTEIRGKRPLNLLAVSLGVFTIASVMSSSLDSLKFVATGSAGHFFTSAAALLHLLADFLAFTVLSAVWACAETLLKDDDAIKADEESRKKLVRITRALSLIILLLGWIATEARGRLADADLRQNMLSRAVLAATAIDPERVKGLAGSPEDKGKPDFEYLRSRLAAIHSTSHLYRFTYLFGLRDGRVVFLGDAEPEDSPDYSPPGQIYVEASQKLIDSFTGGTPFIEGPITDRWGIWVSSHAPIFDSVDGHVVALLGMDISALDWPSKIAAYRLAIIFATLILLLAALFFASMLLNKEMALRSAASEKRFRTIFESAAEGIIIFEIETGQILHFNPFVTKWLGYEYRDENLDLMVGDLFGPWLKDIQEKSSQSPDQPLGQITEVQCRKKDGTLVDAAVTGTALKFREKDCILIFARDITERKRIKEQLQHLATHDSLTNIPNRYFLEETLKRVIAKAKRGGESALLLLDLDNFKLVNDSLGHAAGDELLNTLVKTLRCNLREGDLLARLGGDEFAVLLEGATVKEAERVAEKLRRVIEEEELPLVMHGASFYLSLSIGLVMIDGTLDFQKLLSRADTALYAAKDAGRNKVVIARPDENVKARLTETNHLLSLIKGALKEDRFVLLFQPVVGISDSVIKHYETLVRIRDISGSLIDPCNFIPTAERFGLMPKIDRWVVQSALKRLKDNSAIKLFVNIAGISLGDETLLDIIEVSIRNSAIDPARLGFEITEAAVVKDQERAEQWIRRIKNLGCGFALADFGIGFSSFSYLRMLPVDYFKIDGAFAQNLDSEPTHQVLIQAMNTVAHALGKKTVVEYIETESSLKLLQEMNIDCGQGYFLGRPAPFPKG